MTNPPIEPRTFHNNRFAVFVLLAFAVIAEAMAVCMALETIYLLFMTRGFAFTRLLAAVQWAGAAFCFVYMGIAFWGIARVAWFVHVKFDASGMQFRLGKPKRPEEISMAWVQVAEIRKQQVGSNWLITIVAKDGSYACYTPYNFFRYMKLARLISACAAVPITQLPPLKTPAKTAKASPAQT